MSRSFDWQHDYECNYKQANITAKSSAAKAAVDQSRRRRVADASRVTHSLAMLLAFKEDASELHTDYTTTDLFRQRSPSVGIVRN